jgi:hypothetical protein
MNDVILRISEDEALILFEFFERFSESDKLCFKHPSEYLSLLNICH